MGKTKSKQKLSSIIVVLLVALYYTMYGSGCGRSAKDKAIEADRLNLQAHEFVNQQDYPKALENVRASLLLNNELKRDSALAENYFLLARCQRMFAEYDSALLSFKTSLEYARLLRENQLERKVKIALAEFQYLLGEDEAALVTASDAAAAAKLYGDPRDVYRSLLINAKAYHSMTKYDRELHTLEKLMHIDSLMLSMQHRSELLRVLLRTHIAAGDDQKAREVFKSLSVFAHAKNDSSTLAYAYVDWGKYQQSLYQSDSAVQSFSQALGLLGAISDRSLHIEVLSALGSQAYQTKHFEDAKRYFGDALHVAQQNNDFIMEQMLKVMLVACDWKSQGITLNPVSQELVQRCSSIVAACQQVGFSTVEAFALFILGKFVEVCGDTTESVKNYQSALQLYEQAQGSFIENEVVAQLIDVVFEGEKSGWYDALLEPSCAMNKTSDVVNLFERKNLLELARFFSTMTFQTTDEVLNYEITTLQRKQKALTLLDEDVSREFSSGKGRNAERVEALKKLYPMRVAEMTAAAEKIGSMNQNLRWLVAPKQLTVNQIQDTLPAMSVLVEYVPLANDLYVIIIRSDTTILLKQAINRQRLLSLVHEYNRLISDARLQGSSPQFDAALGLQRISELSSILSNVLVHPLESNLENALTLYVVLPAEFEWFPLHTLRVSGKSFIEAFTISYLPSAAVLFFTSRQEKYVQNVVGVGHQGITSWDVEYELKDIRGFYTEAKLLFGTSASLNQLANSKYDLLHFATEFALDSKRASNSVMQLSDGKTPFGLSEVPLGELLNFSMPPTFIISNISTTPGGLSRYSPMALLASGTQTLIVTMWQGERKSKKYFGEVFYTNLMSGVSSRESYQRAMVALASKREFSQVHRWGLYFRYGR